MKLDTLIRSTLLRVFPILHQIEENPKVIVKREVQSAQDFTTMSETPYAGKTYEEHEVNCIFVEEPQMITTGNQTIIKKQQIFYIKRDDLPFIPDLNDRFVFNGKEYKPTRIQEIFPLLKIEVEKVSV